MTAKEYLRRYEEADRIVQRLRREYEREEELIDSVRSTLGGDGLPHGNGISKPVEDRAIRLADKAARWKIAQLDAIQIRQEVFDLIRDIPGIEGDALYWLYVELEDMKTVGTRFNYSLSGMYKVHKRALAQAELLLNRKCGNK